MSKRIVYIRRVEQNDKTRLPKDLLQESKRPLGPSFNKYGQILRGLELDEEKVIMPEIVNISPNDPTFSKACENFWNNISIPIPAGRGVELNISLKENGYPEAPLDYLKYRFAQKHKLVAASEDDLSNKNTTAMYVIFDPVAQTEKQVSQLKTRNTAKLKYLEIIENTEKMDAVLAVLTSYKNPKVLSPEEKCLIIERKSNEDPEKFIKTVEDPNLVHKSFIYKAINAGVLTETGTRITYEDKVLGEDLDSTIAFIKSKQGSQIRVQIEGKLGQWAITPEQTV